MASPSTSDAEASGGDASLRRRRVDSAEEEASEDQATGAARPALKKLKLDSDDATDGDGDGDGDNDGDVGVTDTSSVASTGENGSATLDDEDDDGADDDTDDMDLEPTQPTAILPDDDENDDDDDASVEVPSTPPPVQLTAAGLARQARASPALRIDPSSKTTGTTPTRVRPTLVPTTPDVVFRLQFPLLSDKSRLLSPVQRDALGQAWRVAWFPHGQFLNDEFVSVIVEMVVDDAVEDDHHGDAALDPSVTTANNGHTAAIAVVRNRPVMVEISILDPLDTTVRKVTHKSSVVLFDNENLELAVEKMALRTRISNPSDSLLDVDGDITLDVRLQFVELVLRSSVSTETMDLDVDLDTHAVSPMDDDDDLLVGTTPVVTPTASGLANLVSTPTTPTNHDGLLLQHDSKQETGMVGLKNQGATCYMNSLLQTLFHLLAFRHVVYETPTDLEDTNDSVSLALQRVFYRLQTQTKAVSTKELTRSFGWSQMDAFMQHDVQELYRILCDRLEEKMKNTKVDNAIKKLFEGKVRSFVQCVNVDFQSFRDESFYDLQLDVKGCKDIYDSFRKYVEIEMLDGDNQYEAEGHGKQDAKKGVHFVHFPPVLNIQLKRFEYDPMRDGMVKIHDRFEYPKTLVLDEFAPKQPLENGVAKSQQLVYHLHSVLVHSGDVHGGHYYVFIRPAKNLAESHEWFRFDDDQISRADEHTAVEGNYGSLGAPVNVTGGSSPSTPLYGPLLSPETTPREGEGGDCVMEFRSLGDGDGDGDGDGEGDGDGASDAVYSGPAAIAPVSSSTSSLLLPAARSFASAYMLVYVRDGANDIRTIQDDEETEPVVAAPESNGVEKEDVPVATAQENDANNVEIPESLLLRFHEEEKASARRKKQQQTEHLYMVFRIASDTSIAKLKKITKNVDFSSFGNHHGLRIRIKRTACIRQLYTRIYQRTGVPIAQQRLWKVITRENRTHRPDTCVSREMLDLRAEALIDDDASPKAPVRLYLQILNEESATSDELSTIFRHFWTEFTAPEEEEKPPAYASAKDTGEQVVDADDDDDLLEDGSENDVKVVPAHNIHTSETLLFIKFYDTTKKLGDRLEYMGNILFDSHQTGRELAAYLLQALRLPASTKLTLYEEIQPVSVSEINLELSLEAAEIQHGDIICYQLRTDDTDVKNGHQENDEPVERYPDVPSYFQYLLDRVDVLFYEFGHPDKEPRIVHLLFSHTYDDIIDELTQQLGFPPERRLYLRLYQQSPLNHLPKKTPLRHSKFSGDRHSTLEDFLSEYSERTTTMYFELLANPITEIESKKQITVYLSSYDECFVDSTAPAMPRRLDCLVSPSDGLSDLLSQIVNQFELDASTKLRACEVAHNGSLLLSILPPDAPLEKYWISATSTGYTTVNDVALFVESIPEVESREIAAYAETMETSSGGGEAEEDSENRLFYFGVSHFNFQMANQHWIHPHGVPFVTYFREQETVSHVKERIRQRIGISEEIFAKWELAVIKDVKASTVRDLFQDMEPEAIEDFAMAKLEDICGSQFENISSLGVEHADMKPSPPKYARRQEQGIKIRQS